MRFLLDENVDLPLKDFLEEQGYDATAIATDYTRSIKDQQVLTIAVAENRILDPCFLPPATALSHRRTLSRSFRSPIMTNELPSSIYTL
jgi:hypothetical protein